MSMTFDEFVRANFPPEQHEIVQRLRALVKAAAPNAREAVSYEMPVWIGDRNIIAYINTSQQGVTFSLVQGVLVNDTYGLLRGKAKWARYVKIRSAEKMNDAALQAALRDYVRQAAEHEAKSESPVAQD
jgi:hypothetical protein